MYPKLEQRGKPQRVSYLSMFTSYRGDSLWLLRKLSVSGFLSLFRGIRWKRGNIPISNTRQWPTQGPNTTWPPHALPQCEYNTHATIQNVTTGLQQKTSVKCSFSLWIFPLSGWQTTTRRVCTRTSTSKAHRRLLAVIPGGKTGAVDLLVSACLSVSVYQFHFQVFQTLSPLLEGENKPLFHCFVFFFHLDQFWKLPQALLVLHVGFHYV